MNPAKIVEIITTRLNGVLPKSSWGEISLFYNPDRKLPNGVYFCTIKEHDGENDKSSKLDRAGVFRLAIGLGGATYERLFGLKPKRPEKGGIVRLSYDFTEIGRLMPHPVYAWMGWAQILSPNLEAFEEIFPYISEAHSLAAEKFREKIIDKPRSSGRKRSR
jgi:hypothetical protein